MWPINSPDLARYAGIFKLTDLLEIIIFAVILYKFLCWLSQSNNKSIAGYFHLYCLGFFAAYFLGLSTINQAILLFTPVILTLLIIFHQKTLQRNFIGVPTKRKHSPPDKKWVEPAVQVCLNIINKNKPIRCIIERKDPLTSLLKSDFVFDANIDKNLLTIMLENSIFNPMKLLWLEDTGKIKAINTSWSVPEQEEWFDQEYSFDQEEKWFEQAQIFTEQTDAVIFSITPEKRTFDIFIGGKHTADVPAYNFLKLAKMYGIDQSSSKKGSQSYEIFDKENIQDQIST